MSFFCFLKALGAAVTLLPLPLKLEALPSSLADSICGSPYYCCCCHHLEQQYYCWFALLLDFCLLHLHQDACLHTKNLLSISENKKAEIGKKNQKSRASLIFFLFWSANFSTSFGLRLLGLRGKGESCTPGRRLRRWPAIKNAAVAATAMKGALTHTGFAGSS